MAIGHCIHPLRAFCAVKMSTNRIEWREPGLGICHVWQIGNNSFGFSTTGIWGEASTFEEARLELENYIAAYRDSGTWLAPNELTFPQLLALHPALQKAFYRLEMLDSNGASATETDIRDWVQFGMLPPDVAARFADEINAACDALESGVN